MEISFPFNAVLVLQVVQQLLLATGGRGSHAPAFYTYQDTVIISSHRSVVSRPVDYTAAEKTFVLSLFFW